MKVIVFVKATAASEAGEMPSEQLLADMGKYNEELVAAGIMQAGEGLKPSSAGARIRFSGANRTLIDGPFAETKELVSTIENMSEDEAEIRHMLHEWSRALEAKDAAGLVKDYAPHAALYDAIPTKTKSTQDRSPWC
jgi:hypothetical protein